MTILYRQDPDRDGPSTAGLKARVFGRGERREDRDNQSLPRVQYGSYQAGAGRHVPLWAYSIPQLNEEERERAELLKLLWPPEAEIHARLRARFARLREELRNQTLAHDHAVELQKPAGRQAAPVPTTPAQRAPAQRVPASVAPVQHPPAATPQSVPAVPVAVTAKPAQPVSPAVTQVVSQGASPAAALKPTQSVVKPVAQATSQAAPPPQPPQPPQPAPLAVPPKTMGAQIADLIAELKQPEKSAPAAAAAIAPAAPLVPAIPSPPPPATPAQVAKAPARAAKAPPQAARTPAPQPQPQPNPRKVRRAGLLEEFTRGLRVRTSYRSRRPCPICGGETHYVASFSTLISGLYRRACKCCVYREPTLVKIHEVDKDGFVSAG